MVTGLQWEHSPMTSMQTTGHRDLVNCLRYGSMSCVCKWILKSPATKLCCQTPAQLLHVHLKKWGEDWEQVLTVKSPEVPDVTVI